MIVPSLDSALLILFCNLKNRRSANGRKTHVQEEYKKTGTFLVFFDHRSKRNPQMVSQPIKKFDHCKHKDIHRKQPTKQ